MRILISLTCLWSSISPFAQTAEGLSLEILRVQKTLDSLQATNSDSLARLKALELKGLAEHQYTRLRYASCGELDSFMRCLCYIDVRDSEFWSIKHPLYYDEARSIYLSATRDLIRMHFYNLEELYKITIHPPFTANLYPYLRHAIEQAGGLWTRGKIPQLEIRPPMRGSLYPRLETQE